jgi:hypothetical protein
MSGEIARKNADEARARASAATLFNVRERELRSAAAYDAIADREARVAESVKGREASATERRQAKAKALDGAN